MAKLDRKRKGCISRYCPLTSLTSFTSLTSKNSSFNFQNPFLHSPKLLTSLPTMTKRAKKQSLRPAA